jgi:hypothetical protein
VATVPIASQTRIKKNALSKSVTIHLKFLKCSHYNGRHFVRWFCYLQLSLLELYLHYLICLHGIVLNQLTKGAT